jgi:hypothetical protein
MENWKSAGIPSNGATRSMTRAIPFLSCNGRSFHSTPGYNDTVALAHEKVDQPYTPLLNRLYG